MKVDVDFLKTQQFLQSIPDLLKESTAIAAEEAGELLDDYNKQNHPSWQTRTGNLEKDIGHKYTESTMIMEHGLGFNPKAQVKSKYGFFSYGVFQHEGTKYISGNQWIFNGAEQNLTKVLKIYEDNFKRVINK